MVQRPFELSFALGKQNNAKAAVEASKKFKAYAKLFQPFSLIPSAALPFLGEIAKIFKEVVENVADTSQALWESASKDLNGLRQEINQWLEELSCKILIVIDDIDRLNSIEIRQIFQLVKALGDFPNTIYLLAFDKHVVIESLKKVQEGPGIDYLEKIVQIPFEVPIISGEKVERYLFDALNGLLEDLPQQKWDENHWLNMYLGGMKYFFATIRDVKRYINNLRFGYNIVIGEVNAADFFAITALQIFTPRLYAGIKVNKSVFVFMKEHPLGKTDEEKKKEKEFCEKLLQEE